MLCCRCTEDLKVKLDFLNDVIVKEVTEDLNAAIENVIAGIRYFRVQSDGPKFRDITISHPLVYRYVIRNKNFPIFIIDSLLGILPILDPPSLLKSTKK